MARYTGAVCKLCRREGKKLYLKGERCYTGKCAVERRAYAPGQHGQSRKKASVPLPARTSLWMVSGLLWMPVTAQVVFMLIRC